MCSISHSSLFADTNTEAAALHNAQDEQDCCKLQDLRIGNSSMEEEMMPEECASRADESSMEMKEPAASTEEDLAAFLLTSLAVADRPVMTIEQEALEREGLTDEEKAAALVDTFGKMCESDVPKKKRARKDLDPSSVAFLVRQMKCEIERIPINKKRALVEAQTKCNASEFSNSRLEKFLRCEGMNAKVCSTAPLLLGMQSRYWLILDVFGSQLAAQRFVNYWESRRQVFGEGKYLMKMTLSGALRDDLVALSACVFRLLPKLDASGRQILFIDPRRHTMNGYDSDSLVRTICRIRSSCRWESNGIEILFHSSSYVPFGTRWK